MLWQRPERREAEQAHFRFADADDACSLHFGSTLRYRKFCVNFDIRSSSGFSNVALWVASEFFWIKTGNPLDFKQCCRTFGVLASLFQTSIAVA
jgi:hypothetical protein